MYYIAIQPALESQHHIKYWQLLKILVQQNLSQYLFTEVSLQTSLLTSFTNLKIPIYLCYAKYPL
jgi:hypothetical protein